MIRRHRSGGWWLPGRKANGDFLLKSKPAGVQTLQDHAGSGSARPIRRRGGDHAIHPRDGNDNGALTSTSSIFDRL